MLASVGRLKVAEKTFEFGTDVRNDGLCDTNSAAAACCTDDGSGAVEEGGFGFLGGDGGGCPVA